MALSKEALVLDTDTVSSRINRVHGPPLPTLLDTNEIDLMCSVVEKKAQSIELIHHMLGGPNMAYHFVKPHESFEAFDYLCQKLIDDLTDNKWHILFFEDRKSCTSNIIIVVIRKPQKHGNREHIVLKALIRLTVMLKLRVGYYHYFDLTGESCFVIFLILNISHYQILHRG